MEQSLWQLGRRAADGDVVRARAARPRPKRSAPRSGWCARRRCERDAWTCSSSLLFVARPPTVRDTAGDDRDGQRALGALQHDRRVRDAAPRFRDRTPRARRESRQSTTTGPAWPANQASPMTVPRSRSTSAEPVTRSRAGRDAAARETGRASRAAPRSTPRTACDPCTASPPATPGTSVTVSTSWRAGSTASSRPDPPSATSSVSCHQRGWRGAVSPPMTSSPSVVSTSPSPSRTSVGPGLVALGGQRH